MSSALFTEAATIVNPDVVLDTPCMVVDETILRKNIEEMQEFANRHGVALRPHIKTHKTPEIARMQLAAGAIGITCAKLGEAEVMADQAGVLDILMAYPVVGAPKIARLLALMDRTHMTIAVDTEDAARGLSDAMVAAGKVLDVYLEVNTGQDRAGAKAGDEAIALAKVIAAMPGVNLVGVMTHEGHAGASDPSVIEQTAKNAGAALVATAEGIRAAGIPIRTVSVGSTPSSRFTPTVAGVTEMRPGTYVFNDNTGFRHGVWGPDRCAARIVATVVSRTAADRCIFDCGSKALALDPSPSHGGHGYVVGHPNAVVARLSEEHGVVLIPDVADQSAFHVGDRYEVIPNHICPTVNLTDELTIVRDGDVIATWKVAARGKVR